MYQIIPRKYRPQKFKNVVGQDSIVATLKNSLLHKRLGQAYLFCGSKGTGKTSLARLFAKALNCMHLSDDQEPCNQCTSCQEIASGHSLNVLEIDGASNRGIDDIRQINETVAYAPASGKYKIYIIDEVHMLTKEAFNALLKTLEEPPSHVKFFFATTEPHKVLPTIISRCQRFDLNRISAQAMEEKIKSISLDLGKEISQEALELLIAMSEGSLRDAESHLDQIFCSSDGIVSAQIVEQTFGRTSKATYLALDQAIADHNLHFAFTLSEEIFSSGKDLSAFMEGLIEHYRTHLRLLLQSPGAHSTLTADQCLHIIEFMIEWSQKLAKTAFKQVGLEAALLHVIRSGRRVSIDTLVHRLLQLEKSIGKASIEATIPTIPLPSKVVEPPIKEKEKIIAEPVLQKPPQIKEEKKIAPPVTTTPAPAASDKARYETLIRFAAVELEGSTER